MADNEGTETVDAPAGTEVTPGGGIVTRADGSQPPAPPTDWRASLPVELQNEPTLAKYKSLDEALKGSVHAQKLVGKGVEFPAADAKPEQVAEFRKRLGVPESPDKYTITWPKAPEGSGMEWDATLQKGFLGRMHAAHARPEAVQAAIDTYVEHMASRWDQWQSMQAQSEQEDLTATFKALEQQWGPRGGAEWNSHLSRAKTSLATLMPNADQAKLDALYRVLGNDPDFLSSMDEMADSLVERGFLGEHELPSQLSQDSAQEEADKIRDAWAKDKENHILSHPEHPDYERVFKHYESLLARAAGPRGREVVAEVMR